MKKQAKKSPYKNLGVKHSNLPKNLFPLFYIFIPLFNKDSACFLETAALWNTFAEATSASHETS